MEKIRPLSFRGAGSLIVTRVRTAIIRQLGSRRYW